MKKKQITYLFLALPLTGFLFLTLHMRLPNVFPSHSLNRMQYAVEQGTIISAKLPRGFDINVPNRKGVPLFFYAPNPNVLEFLIEHGAEVNSGDREGNTFLHVVKSPKMAQMLLEHNAQVNDVNHTGKTPLICQIISENYEMVNFLMAQRDVDKLHRDEAGMDATYYARSCKDTRIVKLVGEYAARIELAEKEKVRLKQLKQAEALAEAREKGFEEGKNMMLEFFAHTEEVDTVWDRSHRLQIPRRENAGRVAYPVERLNWEDETLIQIAVDGQMVDEWGNLLENAYEELGEWIPSKKAGKVISKFFKSKSKNNSTGILEGEGLGSISIAILTEEEAFAWERWGVSRGTSTPPNKGILMGSKLIRWCDMPSDTLYLCMENESNMYLKDVVVRITAVRKQAPMAYLSGDPCKGTNPGIGESLENVNPLGQSKSLIIGKPYLPNLQVVEGQGGKYGLQVFAAKDREAAQSKAIQYEEELPYSVYLVKRAEKVPYKVLIGAYSHKDQVRLLMKEIRNQYRGNKREKEHAGSAFPASFSYK